MQKRIIWILLVFVFILFIALVGGSYYLRYISERIIFANQKKTEESFSAYKKELTKISVEVSLIATGDISYSRGVGRMVAKEKDNNYPFLKIQDYLKGADIVFGNLETPITQGREIPDFDMVFRSNPGTEQALKQAGFSIVSLANNHTPNFGEKGLIDTFKYLDAVGIKYVGAGKNTEEANNPVYFDIKGIKFAFLAYNDPDVVPVSYEATNTHAGTAFMRTSKMVESVKAAKQHVDFVIVSMHSGIEYIGMPDTSQINFAHAAIDAGADLVLGHHPHVVQTAEQYKGKYIFYSLGNFVFDQPQSQNTKEGLMVKASFSKRKINKILPVPIVMENFAQPQEVTEESEKNSILKRLNLP